MKLIVLDRDGTLNEDRDDFVKSPDEWLPLPGALEAVARLNRAGFTVAVATNQSGLARGLFDLATLDAMHGKMQSLLAAHGGRVDRIAWCPHGPEDGCRCRKPRPGLFEQLAAHYGLATLAGVPVVGDTLRDLQAGTAAGGEPHLVRTGKAAQMGEARLAQLCAQVPGTRVHADLAAFADWIIASQGAGSRGAQG
ncbi:D-glycero-beta-D-manno-heptose 1,7-bisphosphate 7-phosphatase [Caldimonas tepidiphila]|uniref:D-glycero-beta-D-manno-heptose 1,7-bisphosphate 7-phosphatase n=1 Tax=Caldimonas tepidiphila TaxID=2315841 RepID=UPI000E5C1D38|nr:D-glycero-beta-D-manno-heptose 1,7-bisphosphate 7-phosphatase [Caldimonas tepidiphila]